MVRVGIVVCLTLTSVLGMVPGPFARPQSVGMGAQLAGDGTSAQSGPTPDWSSFFIAPERPRMEGDVSSGAVRDHDPYDGFPAVFVALSLHQARHGHALVDPGWVVPCEEPWPEVLYGTKLLEAVVDTEYSAEMLHKVHEEAGSGHGHEEVRSTSHSDADADAGVDTTKRGGNLRRRTSGITDTATHTDMHTGPVGTGSQQCAREDAAVVEALRLFKQTFGHVNMRRAWRVPVQHPWPVPMQGRALLGAASRLRAAALERGDLDTVQRLVVLGIVPGEAGDSDQALALDVTIRALARYKTLHSDMAVPQRFVVPVDGAEWPQETWGIPLGQRCKKIQSKELFADADSAALLAAVGFSWDTRLTRTGWALIHSALVRYRAEHGHTCVPFSFVVPEQRGRHKREAEGDLTLPWAAELRGMKLGARVSDIRAGRIYAQHRAELDDMGFEWDAKSLSFERLYRAVALYRKTYGHVVVPPTFVFPDSTVSIAGILANHNARHAAPGDSSLVLMRPPPAAPFAQSAAGARELPTELYGFPLGHRVAVMRAKRGRQQLHQQQIDRLDTLGFVWGDTASVSSGSVEGTESARGSDGTAPTTKVGAVASAVAVAVARVAADSPGLHAAAAIATVAAGHARVGSTASTLMPEDSPRERDARGFEEVVLALGSYKELFGNVLVPSRWVVPSCAPWPMNTWGLALGRRVSSIRHGKAYTGVDGGRRLRSREQVLSDLGFVWEIQRDPRGFAHVYQALVLYRQLHGHLDIPRPFVSPGEDDDHAVVWPRVLWGMNLGRTLYDIRRGAAYCSSKQQLLLADLGVVDVVDQRVAGSAV